MEILVLAFNSVSPQSRYRLTAERVMKALHGSVHFSSSFTFLLLQLCNVGAHGSIQYGVMYPKNTKFRETLPLDGIWNFRLAPRSNPDVGFEQHWFSQALSLQGPVDAMPVPGNYEDIQRRSNYDSVDPLYYHVGWAWYDRQFVIPSSWKYQQMDRRIFLRIGAAHYYTIVYINGQRVTTHEGGSVPIVTEISPTLLSEFGEENRITIAVNNTLCNNTLPQSLTSFSEDPRDSRGTLEMVTDPQFRRYAGIHGSVVLYTTPLSFIDDIKVSTWNEGTVGYVSYAARVRKPEVEFADGQHTESSETGEPAPVVRVQLEDQKRNITAEIVGVSGTLQIPQVKLWWPLGMVPEDETAYLYNLKVTLMDSHGNAMDSYSLRIGIRTVSWNEKSFFVNGRPFYFKGCGRYEYEDLHASGVSNILFTAKDLQSLRLLRCNVYRLSHHPHDEHLLDMADQMGIVVIQHIPASFFIEFSRNLQAKHKLQISALVQRDTNRPSVVMWSVAYVPRFSCQLPGADEYLKEVIEFTRTLDESRPLIIISDLTTPNCSKHGDILALHSYAVLHKVEHMGHLVDRMVGLVREAIQTYRKPLLLAEFGMHMWELSSEDFSEEQAYNFGMYAVREFWTALDIFNAGGKSNNNATGSGTVSGLIGELIWNQKPFFRRLDPSITMDGSRGINSRQPVLTSVAWSLQTRYLTMEANGWSGLYNESDYDFSQGFARKGRFI